MDHIERFAQVVVQGGIHCTIRRPRGQGKKSIFDIFIARNTKFVREMFIDIMAACGQLKSSEMNKSR